MQPADKNYSVSLNVLQEFIKEVIPGFRRDFVFENCYEDLMKIIDKIEGLGLRFSICRRRVSVKLDTPAATPIFADIKHRTKRESIYWACYKAVLWINKVQQSTEKTAPKNRGAEEFLVPSLVLSPEKLAWFLGLCISHKDRGKILLRGVNETRTFILIKVVPKKGGKIMYILLKVTEKDVWGDVKNMFFGRLTPEQKEIILQRGNIKL